MEIVVFVLSLMVVLLLAGYVAGGVLLFKFLAKRSGVGVRPPVPTGQEQEVLNRIRSEARKDIDELPPDLDQTVAAYPSDARDDVLDWIRERRASGSGWDGIRAGVKGSVGFDDQVEEM